MRNRLAGRMAPPDWFKNHFCFGGLLSRPGPDDLPWFLEGQFLGLGPLVLGDCCLGDCCLGGCCLDILTSAIDLADPGMADWFWLPLFTSAAVFRILDAQYECLS